MDIGSSGNTTNYDSMVALRLTMEAEKAIRRRDINEVNRILQWADRERALEASPALCALLKAGCGKRVGRHLRLPDWVTARTRAAEILADYTDASTTVSLASSVLEDNSDVRYAAARSLRLRRDRQEVGPIDTAATILSDCISNSTRWNHEGMMIALDTLGQLKSGEGASCLINMLRSPRTSGRNPRRTFYRTFWFLFVGFIAPALLFGSGGRPVTLAIVAAVTCNVLTAISFALVASGFRNAADADKKVYRNSAANALAKLAYPPAIPAIVGMLGLRAALNRPDQLITALIPALEAMTSRDVGLLDSETERRLSGLLLAPYCTPELAHGILKALKIAGTGISLQAVERFAGRDSAFSEAFISESPREMAVELIPLLQERKRHSEAPTSLLRAGSAPSLTGEQLVRAAASTPGTTEQEAATLLRPTSEQEALKQSI
jgi:hypothetical protein